ncbi:MAG: PilZ domain-containing protein [Proteobacteria bacterium]|nr:PilZ domain-containing protein [Pseudomonadota bacterium]
MEKKNRKNTRNKVWPETEVQLKFRDKAELHSNSITKIKAKVDNLSASGLFALTEERISSQTEVDIKIDFQPGEKKSNFIHATGIVLRQEDNGVAVQFTKIDTQLLGECIMAKLNSQK